MTAKRPAATTPEGRENQMIAKAIDLAERQIEEGTASAAVLTHFLKLGTTRERLEQKRMMKEIELMQAKADQMASAANIEKLYTEAIDAMRNYGGGQPGVDFGGGYEDPDVQ